MKRRTFLGAAAAALGGTAAPAARILDTHVHFYDPTRPQGTPWPPKDDKVLNRPVLPDEYVKMTKPLGIAGAIVVEASPWVEDNQWVLDLAKRHPVIKGLIGHLEPAGAEFSKQLERFSSNPLFRGIRLNRFPQTSIAAGLSNPQFLEGLKRLAAANLTVDVVGGAAMLPGVARLSDRVAGLRIVVDHLPIDRQDEQALRELGKRPLVYAKVSNVLRRGEGFELSHYRPALDLLCGIFGPDRVVYGSNWPVSDHVAPYDAVLRIVREYFVAKGPEAAEKYFWRNSIAAYRWQI